MSALGHKLPRRFYSAVSTLPLKADATPPIAGGVGSPFVGRATRSARLALHVDLLGYSQSIINLDAKIANRALDLGVAKQQLDGPQIAGAAID